VVDDDRALGCSVYYDGEECTPKADGSWALFSGCEATKAKAAADKAAADKAAAVKAAAEVPTCPQGWKVHGGDCYQRQTQGKFYDAAKSVCSGLGAHLAVPNTAAENTFLTTTMNPKGDSYTWLGFDYTNGEKWEDGGSADSTSGWRVLYNVHDAADRVNGEPVVFIRPDGAWSFEGKSYNYPYICEKANAVERKVAPAYPY